jgi:hypothetical protein
MADVDVAALRAKLDALRDARASGLLETQHGETRTRYKSDAEMARAIADLQQQINGATPGSARGPKYAYQTGKGL